MRIMHASTSGSIAAALPDRAPSLVTLAPGGPARGVALIAHGGRSKSTAPDSNLRSPALRMFPFLGDLARAGRRGGLAVAQLRYRVVGYNDGDPVRDVEWALEQLSDRFARPGVHCRPLDGRPGGAAGRRPPVRHRRGGARGLAAGR